MEKGLTPYQKGIIIDMASEHFECGHPMVDYDEIIACMNNEDELKDVAEQAAEFYQDVVSDGAPAFFDEYSDDDDIATDNIDDGIDSSFDDEFDDDLDDSDFAEEDKDIDDGMSMSFNDDFLESSKSDKDNRLNESVSDKLKKLNEKFATKEEKKPLKEDVEPYEGELVVSEDGDRCYTSAEKLLKDLNDRDIWPQDHSLEGIAKDHDTADYWRYYPSVAEYVKKDILNPWQWDGIPREGVDIASATIDMKSHNVSFVLGVMPDEAPEFYDELYDMVDRGHFVQDDENAFTCPEHWYWLNEDA